MSAQKRVRMFAGPNGSGKSTLIESLRKNSIPIDPVVNADEIAIELTQNGKINLTNYGLHGVTFEALNGFMMSVPELQMRRVRIEVPLQLNLSRDILFVEKYNNNTLIAAFVADCIRHLLLSSNKSFSFETVMSHSGKIQFMKDAKSKGYKTYLYFLGTEDVEINIRRVQIRTELGGHTVPEDKIRSRYSRSMELLLDALNAVDKAYVLDSSSDDSMLIFEKNEGIGQLLLDEIPDWFGIYVLDRIEAKD